MSIFSKIKVRQPRRSKFNLSHEKKLSLKAGPLYPVFYEEIFPGDKMSASSEVFMRMAPMVYPIMQRIKCEVHYFFVPWRLVYDQWEDWIGGGKDGDFAGDYPRFDIAESRKGNFIKGRLPDYFGIPITDGIGSITEVTSLDAKFFRAYHEIVNEYFIDENLDDPLPYSKAGGLQPAAEQTALTELRLRAWSKDYFTSALPWAQRGGEVVLPVSTPFTPQYSTQTTTSPAAPSDGTNLTGNADGTLDFGGGAIQVQNLESQTLEGTSVSVNELRRAYRLQEWLENNARGGYRYVEQLLSHWGVRSSDARLQRPEFLGVGKFNVRISEVLNQTGDATNPSPTLDPGGQMYGHGVTVGKSNGFKRFFEEHGAVIGLMSIQPQQAYFQGIHKRFTRPTRLDYPWPEFANLGEQEIQQKEIFVNYTATQATNDATFGYTPRYAEVKYGCSTIHGDFRDSLDRWHWAQKYQTAPALNKDFVYYANDNRIFNAEDQNRDNFYCHIYNKVNVLRRLPYFGTPRT